MKKKLATITILLEDRHTCSGAVNDILTQNSNLIVARMGVNVSRACVSNCPALITVTAEATVEEINKLVEALNVIPKTKAKSLIMTE